MKKKDRQAYIQAIKPLLSEKRFEHSLNVAQEAVKLAKKYGADPEKAEAAGILHDILKDTPADKQLKIISDFGIIMNDVTVLEKVVFVADFISKDRDYPGVEEMRKTAYKSLDRAIVEGIAFTVGALLKDREPVVPETVDAYNDAVWAVRHGK